MARNRGLYKQNTYKMMLLAERPPVCYLLRSNQPLLTHPGNGYQQRWNECCLGFRLLNF